MPSPHAVRRIPHVPITARDGTILSAAVFLPDGVDGPIPAVLDALPYRKDDDFLWTDWDTYAVLASLGFGCVRLDLRGTGSSDGILPDEYTTQEHDDIEDAIAQIAALPWCNGRVGMTGVSWGGFNAIQVAMRRPPALGAIVPVHWSSDRYATDVHYYGGVMQLRDTVDWQGSMIVENALPPHRALVGEEAFERIWRERLEQMPFWPSRWLHEQRRSDYWRHGSLCEDWAAVEVPVLAIGGWLDGYQRSCLDLLERGSMPRRAVLGPWAHTRPHNAWPPPSIDYHGLMARWFRRFLADDENGVDEEPMLTAYLLDGIPAEPFPDAVAGRWHAFSHWPSGVSTALTLGDDGTLGERALAAPREWRGPARVGVSMPWWGTGGPPTAYGIDARDDDEQSLSFTSEPLDEPLAILGEPVTRLRVAADRPVALAAVRLLHVRPDGRSFQITRGLLNLTHRDSHAEPAPLVPGEPVDVEIALDPTGVVVPAGHRLRVAVSGALFPIAWPPPEPVCLTLLSGSLTLPQPDGRAEVPAPDLGTPDLRGVANPVDHRASALPPSFTVEREHMTRRTRVRSTDGWTAILPDDGLSAGTSDILADVVDHDPLSARAYSQHTATVRLDGVTAHARSSFEVRCTRDTFVLHATLVVERDGQQIFSTTFDDEAPRDLM